MTELLLIRHGQANFGGDDYDRLSALGEQQATLLGSHLRREGRTISRAISGTLRRQLATAQFTMAELEAEPGTTKISSDAAFDEYPADALFAAYMPLVMRDDPDIAAAADVSSDDGWHRPLRSDRRLFQRALAAVTAHWTAGTSTDDPPLSWADFNDRIADGLQRVRTDAGRDETVAIFTSGGVIATAIGQICGMGGDTSMALSWRVMNASVSELVTGRNGFALTGFNSISHLRMAGDPALLTWR